MKKYLITLFYISYIIIGCRAIPSAIMTSEFDPAITYDKSYVALLSPDNTKLAFLQGPFQIKLFNLKTKTIAITNVHNYEIRQLIFNKNERQIASVDAAGYANIWDTKTGELLYSIDNYHTSVLSIEFSPDGSLIAANVSIKNKHNNKFIKMIYLYNSETGKRILTLNKDCHKLLFNNTDSEVLKSNKNRPFVESSQIKNNNSIFKLNKLTSLNSHTEISYDNQYRYILTESGDRKIEIWDALNGLYISSINVRKRTKYAEFSNDSSKVLTVTNNNIVQIWDMKTGKEIFSHKFNTGHTYLNKDGTRLIIKNNTNELELWNIETKFKIIKFNKNVNLRAKFDHAGKRIFITELPLTGFSAKTTNHIKPSTTVEIYDANTGKNLFSLQGHTKNITYINESEDGTTIATTSEDGTIKIWDAQIGTLLQTIKL